MIDRASGRPLSGVDVTIVGTPPRVMRTDLDGRFRSGPLAPGTYAVRAGPIGYAPQRIDSVRVAAGETAELALSLAPQAIALEGLTVEAAATPRSSSEAGLLAQQRTAAVVQDGISAQQIGRAPDSDAGDAIVRMPGVSVVDDRFVVIRGLGERYGNTLLNGAELASPEPLKKIVPLDIFPASLLESIVTTKTATPDRPGDFAGGSVEIRTREFPENPVLEWSLSQGGNSRSSFRRFPQLPRTLRDWSGFDDGRRAMPRAPETEEGLERFGESLRNRWTPAPRRPLPDLGAGVSAGSRMDVAGAELGWIASLNYAASTAFVPERLFLFVTDTATGEPLLGSSLAETTQVVDWGALLNVSVRVGAATKVGWKNLYTRNAEEYLAAGTGFNPERQPPEVRSYQVRYVERGFLQTQLSGEHELAGLGRSRLRWSATLSRADRDEPENRSLTYLRSADGPEYTLSAAIPNFLWFRFLDDRIRAVSADWSLPVPLPHGEGTLQAGGLRRVKDRRFDASLFSFVPVTSPPGGAQALALPPERATAPENIGTNLDVRQFPADALPYESDDDLTAAYLMADLVLLPGVRLVGGVRMEDWRLNLYPGTRDDVFGEAVARHNRDWLPSANLTVALGERMNLRLAGYGTVARPDPREVSESFYVAVTGECVNLGAPDLVRTRIANADVRWEWYPRPGEVISVAGFYKRFTDPIVEVVDQEGLNCRVRPRNAARAVNRGAEVEMRTGLDFLPGPLARLSTGVNLTFVDGEVTPSDAFTLTGALPLYGQSRYLANASLGYADADARLEATLLYNAFGDRVLRYGLPNAGGRTPDVYEEGRGSLDLKLRKGFGERLSLSVSGRNLTGEVVRYRQETAAGPVTVGWYRLGVSFSAEVGYAF